MNTTLGSRLRLKVSDGQSIMAQGFFSAPSFGVSFDPHNSREFMAVP
jgi:hypothetical protein